MLGSGKYRLSRYMSPLMVPAPMRMAIAAPTRTRPQLRLTSAGHRNWLSPQAKIVEPAARESRVRRSPFHRWWERDQHAGGNEQQQTQLEDPFCRRQAVRRHRPMSPRSHHGTPDTK